MHNNSPKRAQLEIFGLAVIIILLALGLLFTLTILSKQPNTTTQQVKENVQAANFLNTLLGTTVEDCGKRSVRELLSNCALADETWTGAASCDDGTTTCQHAQTIISELLRQTFGNWGKTYSFSITGTPSVQRITAGTPCTGEREGSTRPEKIRAGLDILITLHLCRT